MNEPCTKNGLFRIDTTVVGSYSVTSPSNIYSQPGRENSATHSGCTAPKHAPTRLQERFPCFGTQIQSRLVPCRSDTQVHRTPVAAICRTTAQHDDCAFTRGSPRNAHIRHIRAQRMPSSLVPQPPGHTRRLICTIVLTTLSRNEGAL